MSVMSLESSKQLKQYLEDVDVSLYYCDLDGDYVISGPSHGYEWSDYPAYEYTPVKIKTLTVEEAIDFIRKELTFDYSEGDSLKIYTRRGEYCVDHNYIEGYFTGKTLIEAIENMLIYYFFDR